MGEGWRSREGEQVCLVAVGGEVGKKKEMLKMVRFSFHSQIQYCLGIDNRRGIFYILEYSKGEQYSFKKVAREVCNCQKPQGRSV